MNQLIIPNLQKIKNLPNMPLCAVNSQNGDKFGDSFLTFFFIPFIEILDYNLKLSMGKFQPLEIYISTKRTSALYRRRLFFLPSGPFRSSPEIPTIKVKN